MAYDVLVLVLLKELAGRGKCDLVDVPVNLLLGHADTIVNDLQRLGLLVKFDTNLEVAQLALEVTVRGDCLHLLRGVNRIRHQFPQEYLVIRIEELFDDREYVLGRHSDLSFVCHNIFHLNFYEYVQSATPSR